MTNFVNCSDCGALTLDLEDEIVRHRYWHRDLIAKNDGTRRVANDAKNALAGLRSDIQHYERQLVAHPIAVEPEQIRIREMPTDEELGIEPATEEDDHDEHDDVAPDTVSPETPQPVPATAAVNAYVPPAIDRDDEYDPFPNRA